MVQADPDPDDFEQCIGWKGCVITGFDFIQEEYDVMVARLEVKDPMQMLQTLEPIAALLTISEQGITLSHQSSLILIFNRR
ncbi:MAG: hypothetical protein OXH65_00520 [Paracoccaceae bacterium]|nr:hypothetical protein [Paracoccaceae bacterium]